MIIDHACFAIDYYSLLKGVTQMAKLTEEQRAEISAGMGINIGPDATARENGLVVKYLVDKALQQK